ncbi:MAG: GNAT family N-acetyltransferase [Acidobacteria bacterium]|nr:GNAT family N-acetyltransferase [Acidobacteriota bacterium]
MDFILETERLLLRDLQEEDWEWFAASFKDPLTQSHILSFQSDDQFIERYFEQVLRVASQKTRFSYAPGVVLKAENLLIGSFTLSHTFTGSMQGRIGWHLDSLYQGRGYATEAARALLTLAFSHHQVARIYAECFAANVASRRVMEKLGMRLHRSGFFRRWLRGINYGEQKPIVRYYIHQSEWVAGNSQGDGTK